MEKPRTQTMNENHLKSHNNTKCGEDEKEALVSAFRGALRDRMAGWLANRKCLCSYSSCDAAEDYNYTANVVGIPDKSCWYFFMMMQCLICGGVCSIHNDALQVHRLYVGKYNLPLDEPGLCLGQPFQELRRLRIDHMSRVKLKSKYGV
jgi:hypothetical protein